MSKEVLVSYTSERRLDGETRSLKPADEVFLLSKDGTLKIERDAYWLSVVK